MAEKTITTISEARECLGPNNVFGPDEWKKYFPGMIEFTEAELAQIEDIPWPKSVLMDPKTLCKEEMGEHFLFLGVEKAISGMKFSLFYWLTICQKCFSDPITLRSWYTDDWRAPRPIGVPPGHYTERSCALKWYLMPKDVLKSSIQKYDVHQPMEYEKAEAIEVVTANILYYLLNGKFLPMVENGVRSSSVSVSNYGKDICVWLENEKLNVGTFPPGKYPGAALCRVAHE